MTPEAQRIAIAEVCGWTNIKYQGVEGLPNKTYLAGKPPKNSEDAIMGDVWPIPDYPTDLNAMHEAEKILNKQQVNTYALLLGQLVECGWVDFGAVTVQATTKVVSATAAQRAEAFLRTIGKWTTTDDPRLSAMDNGTKRFD